VLPASTSPLRIPTLTTLQAVAGGAEIVMKPTDQSYASREYSARDHEGHVWSFGTYRPGAGHVEETCER
jgi:uncharacterized glyoxalase superfamily protein PhnB